MHRFYIEYMSATMHFQDDIMAGSPLLFSLTIIYGGMEDSIKISVGYTSECLKSR